MAMETKEKHKCPPHHFMIDSNDVGVCRYCGEVRNFRRLLERERRAFEGGSSIPRKKSGRPKKEELLWEKDYFLG